MEDGGHETSPSNVTRHAAGDLWIVAHLSAVELHNWIALYAAAGVCCALGMIMSLGLILVQLYREQAWATLTTGRGLLLFIPNTWWRWQKLYLLSTPVTLGIVGAFATTLAWT